MNRLYIIAIGISYFSFVVLIGCDSRVNPFKEDIAMLQSRPLYLPLDSMRKMKTQGEDSVMLVSQQDVMKLVVYTDTADCSSCVLRKMYKWNGLLKKLEVYGGRIQPYFIFRPLSKDMGVFYMSMKQITPSCPVYLDSLGVLERANPQIPSNPDLHTFLLDEDNNVLLVGNPIWNEKIKEMFWQIVEEKLGKRE